MHGGLLKSASRLAIVATAVTMGGVSAYAADLGGNCCADLEERVAELEATTARKGNRKVKLTVSGQVNEALIFWDDGSEQNHYVVSNNAGRTRFRFVGDAKINADWSAGYLLEIGVRYAASNGRSQLSSQAGGDSNSLDIRHSAWWLESKQWGRVWVGETSSATDGITEINLANVIPVGNDLRDVWQGTYRLRRSGTTGQRGLSGLNWVAIQSASTVMPGEGDRNNVVKYVSPTMMGFSFQAAWGEDDIWDVALRYAGEFSGFRVAGGIGYRHNNDGNNPGGDGMNTCSNLANPSATGPVSAGNVISPQFNNISQSAVDCEQIGLSASVMHVATGLFITGAYGFEQDQNRDIRRFGSNRIEKSHEGWYLQAGIEQNWLGFGKTTLYGEYGNYHYGAGIAAGVPISLDGSDPLNPFPGAAGTATARLASTQVTVWGLGVVQSIDAAAMDLYLAYRNFQAEGRASPTGAEGPTSRKLLPIDDFHAVMMGGIIRF